MIGTRLTQLPAWKALAAHHDRICDVHLRTLFADHPQRGERLAAEAAGLYLDHSKHRVTDETVGLLLEAVAEPDLSHDSSTNALIRRYRRGRGR